MIDSTTGLAAQQQVQRETPLARQTASGSASKQGDIVAISDDASAKMSAWLKNAEMMRTANSQAETQPADGKWSLSSALSEGVYTLEDGTKQTVKIDGNSLEIKEYREGKLVKSVSGSIMENGATLDTTFYDASGDISQVIHTDILELEGAKGWSQATMNRSLQWYEGGKLKGEMQDSLRLSSWNSGLTDSDEEEDVSRIQSMLAKGTDRVVPTVEELNKILTIEKHIASYHANVREFGIEGKVSREIVLDHEGRYKQISNRSSVAAGNMEGPTTRELEHDTNLSVTIRDYDKNGKLVRDASFNDRQKDKADVRADGQQEQSVHVTWYADGEKVKQSYGSMSIHETDMAQLRERPGILETLALSTGDYLGDEPQSAVELLAQNAVQRGSEPESTTDGLVRLIGAGAYDTAEEAGTSGFDQPYNVNWTDEVYKDGELALRQRDSQSARETSYYQKQRAILFAKGHGLTENDSPTLLHETAHAREVYENGELKDGDSMRLRENIDLNHDGPDKLMTNGVFVHGVESNATTTAARIEGGLMQADTNPNAAAKGMGTEIDLTLDGMRQTFGNMNVEDMSTQSAHRVKLTIF